MLPKNIKIPPTDQLVAAYLYREQARLTSQTTATEFKQVMRDFFLGLLLFFYKVFVVTQGWAWFVKPLNAAVPGLSYWTVAGLMLLVIATRLTSNLSAKTKKSHIGYAVALALAHGLLFVFHFFA